MEIKNIIFDLGNVIINIDVALTVKAFIALAPEKVDYIQENVLQSAFFHDFETGKISPAEFREGMRQALSPDLKDAQIDAAWNALLLDIPQARIDLLQALKPHFRTYVLSNTNTIHVDFIVQQMQAEQQAPLSDLVEKVYYSQEMGKRKPQADIYEQVLEENHLLASETVFLDDNQANVEAAQALGIQTIHILPGKNSMLDFFEKTEAGTFKVLL
ncbi:MAG: HAD family phosphatase [Bacteroidota bacterium]